MQRLQRASALLDMGKPALAADEYRSFLSEFPEHASARADLALCLLKQKMNKEALAEARLAVETDPEQAWCHSVLSEVLRESGARKAGLKAAETARRLEPESAYYWGSLAMAYFQNLQWVKAEEACRKGLQLDPGDHNSKFCRYLLLLTHQKNERAIEEIEDALSVHTESAHHHSVLGLSQLFSGRCEAAARAFVDALNLDPEDAFSKDLLGYVKGPFKYVVRLLRAVDDGPGPGLVLAIALVSLAKLWSGPALINLLVFCAQVGLEVSILLPLYLATAFGILHRQVHWPRTVTLLAGHVVAVWPLSLLFYLASLSFHLHLRGRRALRSSAWVVGFTVGWLTLAVAVSALPAWVASASVCAWCCWYLAYCRS